MADIVTDLGVNYNWKAYKNGYNSFTIALTNGGVAFDASDYAFTLKIKIPNGATKLTLTEGSGITNGGATGILTIELTQTQASTTLPRSDYFWELTYVVNGLTYRMLQGNLTLSSETNPASTSTSVSVSVNLAGTSLTADITVPPSITSASVTDALGYTPATSTGLAEHIADTDAHELEGKLEKGYTVVAYQKTSFDANNDLFTHGEIRLYTPVGGMYIVAAGSITLTSGRLLLASSTAGTYTPLDDESTTQGAAAYLVSAAIGGFDYVRGGVLVLGYNYVDHFFTQWNLIHPQYWLTRETLTPWNNVGSNAAAIADFIGKLRSRDVNDENLLNLILYGDSIFGRIYRAEITEAADVENAPPAMYRTNVAKKLLDNFQIPDSNLTYFPVKDMSGFVSQDSTHSDTPSVAPPDSSFVTLTGTWSEYVNYDYTYFKKTNTAASSIEFNIGSGFSRASLIAQRSLDSATQIDVTVSVNGGAYQAPSAAGLTGSDSFSLQKSNGTYSGKWQRFYRQNYSGLTPANSYKFKFTYSALNTFWVWGMEAWDTASLRIINSVRGAHTIGALSAYLYDDVINTNYKPDALIFELPMLNDSYSATTPAFSKDLTTLQNLDAVLLKIAESNIPTICIIPHPSSSESAWYERYIQFARTYAAKYGFPAIDMYEKWDKMELDGRADGTHLDDDGVTYYYEEIAKILNFDGPIGSPIKTSKTTQSGSGQCGVAVTFATPYLSTPKIKITPKLEGATTPAFQYISASSTTGFTVTGTGYFDWEASI